jgi:hypothetical protein
MFDTSRYVARDESLFVASDEGARPGVHALLPRRFLAAILPSYFNRL